MFAFPPHPTKATSRCLCAFLAITIMACSTDGPEQNLYVAHFGTQPKTEVLAERVADGWVIRNGEERIVLRHLGEELYAVPVFGGSWKGRWAGEEWRGHWTDSLRPGDYRVPLTLTPLVHPKSTSGSKTASRWDTSEGTLLLQTRQDSVWATISTPTGDYRYLAGKKSDNILTFNTFDGAHLFRFSATLKGDSLVQGYFLSGTHYKTSFDGVLSPDGGEGWKSGRQTFNGAEMALQGVNATGDTVTWDKSALEAAGKTGLVVDVMGTWCPNCMDEARLLAELAPSHPDVQFVSLAFERSTDASILPRLAQFQKELQLSWDVLLGGKASKRIAAECLGVVDTVHSFPTTVFWVPGSDPVIHTGFNGPATGEGYVVERAFFENQLNRLSGRSENH
ncbi:MAG: hypothetical protein CMC99_04125 [Flavobacteriales bacterium]|nr:hypothetical protein [Flavobacteriales bacterium]